MPKFGLIGRHLLHSFSPAYFQSKFERLNLPDHQYLLLDWPDVMHFRQFVLDKPEFVGFNVTIPFKVDIIPQLDQMDPVAATVGAVNTVVVDEGGMTCGFNTDIIGIEDSLDMLLGSHIPRMALIFGTGGAAKAVAFVLRQRAIPFEFVSRGGKGIGVSYAEANAGMLQNADLIINTSPVGMSPNIDQSPAIDVNLLQADQYLFDLIYNPEKTVFLAEGQRRGAKILSGKVMLEAQAEASWKLWNSPRTIGHK